jgi:NADPH:quinone reductase-like Zn-dependent oxidoreductase
MHVRRDDLSTTELVNDDVPPLGDDQALLRVEVVGLTTNNVTYAALGDQFHYWDFFPAPAPWGTVPLWGFGEVVASRHPGLEVGQRFYGYYPSATYLVVTADSSHPVGFKEVSEHRAHLPSPYNTYADVADEKINSAHLEHLHALYRPLFWTSFMLADRITDADPDARTRVVVTSASSKTAYIAAFLLQRAGRSVVGLTSPRNVDFTRSLGVYEQVIAYDDVADLGAAPTTVIDFLGDDDLAADLRDHLGEQHESRVVAGATSQDIGAIGTLDGADSDDVFFAPVQMRKRLADWGREELDRRYDEAWATFIVEADGFVDLTVGTGIESLRDAWQGLEAGRVDPRDGLVFTLTESSAE